MALEIDVKFTEKRADFNAEFGPVEFLPVRIVPATADTLGGIKVGDGLSITSDGTLSADKPILWNTTEFWNSQRDLIAARGVMYVYSDYKTIDGVTYSNYKMGDGTSYLVDMPFSTIDTVIAEAMEAMTERFNEMQETVNAMAETVNSVSEAMDHHITDTDSHVSENDRELWSSKVTAKISDEHPETLLLTKD